MEASFLRPGYLFGFVLFFSQGRKRAPPESVVDFTYKHASILKNARELNHGQVPTVVRLKDELSWQKLIYLYFGKEVLSRPQ